MTKLKVVAKRMEYGKLTTQVIKVGEVVEVLSGGFVRIFNPNEDKVRPEEAEVFPLASKMLYCIPAI